MHLQTSVDELLMTQHNDTTRPVSSAATDRLSQHSKMVCSLMARELDHRYLSSETGFDLFERRVEGIGRSMFRQLALRNHGECQAEVEPDAARPSPLRREWTARKCPRYHHATHKLFLQIERFDQLNRDQLVCVSTTRTYISSSDRQREVDVKADWARTRNRFGDQATDIRVSSTLGSFPHAADPYGPPLLTLDDQQQRNPTTKPPPAPMYRRLAIEQPAAKPAPATTAGPSPSMMKDSLVLSEDDESDDEPNSEIERITNVHTDGAQSSRPITPRTGSHAKTSFSQLFPAEATSSAAAKTTPPTKKSDSDDDDDFIKMLKRK